MILSHNVSIFRLNVRTYCIKTPMKQRISQVFPSETKRQHELSDCVTKQPIAV